jgi:mono/diheme cytochrome c family protein
MSPRTLIAPGLSCALLLAGGSSRASAQDIAKVAEGKAVFEKVCTPCHGAGPGTDGAPTLPGPAALALKYKGRVSPLLERRADLTAAALKAFVRNGTGAMPMFRKTEITDSQIEAIAAYLKESAKESPYVPPDSAQKN